MSKITSRTGLSMIIFAITLLAALIIAGVIQSQRNTQKITPLTAITAASIDGIILPKDQTLAPFQLSLTNGSKLTNSSLTGHWTLMFFGFTHCPYVCPTTMTALAKMYQSLEKKLPEQQVPQVVMISVDPARDSLSTLQQFVEKFNPHFLGARAGLNDLTKLTKQLHITFNKIPATDGDTNAYTITHSAQVLIIDPTGNFHAYLSYPHKATEMAKDYINIVSTYNANHSNRPS